MNDPLELLLADGVIDEISGRLKSGKEADLWLVRHGGHIIAAKVYKARHVRSFRNNAGYKEGRQVRDTRTQRAMDRGSRFGQEASEEAWKTKEADALHALHAAGVRVPTPVMFYEGVLLMELVVDTHGHPAPRLVDAHVAREHAAALYADLRGQVVRMLGSHLIHGDLSPYNVLLGASGPVVIDFPQVVGAAHNSQAESYFLRDLENVRRFFAAIDPALQSTAGDAREIWRAYVRGELTPDFVPSGRIPEAGSARGHRPRAGNRERPSHAAGTERKGRAHDRSGHDRDREHQDRHPAQHDRPHGHPGPARPERKHQDRHPAQQGRAAARPDHPPAQHGRGTVQQDRGRAQQQPDRRQHAGPAPHPARPAGAESRTRHVPEAAGQQRRSGRRPAPPAPEVVRVIRPRLGGGATPAPGPRGPSGGTPAQSKPAHAQHHRRRRGREQHR